MKQLIPVICFLLYAGALSYSHKGLPEVYVGLPRVAQPFSQIQEQDFHHPEHHGHEHEAAHGHHEAAHGHHAGNRSEEAAEHEPLETEEQAAENESFSLACFLLGGVAALMLVFYLVNSEYIGIKAATWRVLNMTASIFVAVLLYGTIKIVLLHLFEPGFHATIALDLAVFVIVFIGTHALLFKLKGGDKTRLAAYSTVMGHMSGFAAMYGFAECQEVEYLEELHSTGIIILIAGAAGFIVTLAYVMDKVMLKMVDSDGVRDEDEMEWIDTCDETDDDVFCLAISFLIVVLFRSVIRGRTVPYEPGKVGNVTQSDTNALFLIACEFFALVGAGAALIIKFHSEIEANAFYRRVSSNFQHLNSMIMAWSLLFWAEWQLYVWGWESTIIGGCLVVAVFLTVISFGTVILLTYIEVHFQEKLARRAMGSIELGLGVLVGFSWERAFDVGFEEIEHTLKHRAQTEVHGFLLHVGLSCVMVAIVAPAWRLYILPKALKVETKWKNQSARTALTA